MLEESKAAAAQQVVQRKEKKLFCAKCEIKFDRLGQFKAHKMKNDCKKKELEPYYLLGLNDSILAIKQDMSVNELKCPPGFTVGGYFSQ